MEEVRLETVWGAQREFVATGIMPAFETWPEVVVWGHRVFQLVTLRMEGEPTIYREVSCVRIVDTKPEYELYDGFSHAVKACLGSSK